VRFAFTVEPIEGLFAAERCDVLPPVVGSRQMDRYSGMTMGERLYAAGLLDEFSAAIRKRDRQLMFQLLSSVRVADAEAAVETCLRNPPTWARR